MIRRLIRCFSNDPYTPEFLEQVKNMGNNYPDARAFDRFSFRELKRRLSPEEWEKFSKDDPMLANKEIEEIWDIEDVKPFYHKYLPPHLTRPVMALNKRQIEARRLTIQFVRDEPAIKNKRRREKSAFPILSSDDFEIQTGLLILREPIWLIVEEEDMQWHYTRYNTYKAHKLVEEFSQKMETPKSLFGLETDRDIRIRELDKKVAAGEDVDFPGVPWSTHYLEANRYETDHRSLAYAGGYKAYLLVKDKETQKWGFPTQQMLGFCSFEKAKNNLVQECFGSDFQLHHWGPKPAGIVETMFDSVDKRNRPTYFEEDLFELYLKRMKILFPKMSETSLIKQLDKKYDMKPVSEPLVREVQGLRTFYFTSIYMSGKIDLNKDGKYDDYAWVPKIQFNKFLSREDFKQFIKFTTVF